ncbi:conserved hypothetical protein [Roseibium sp. TrichSKD4]|uniref:flagellar hook-length control protein FliK n=1 Tax=Roseibium sp. TrichSKD4 TaxID=744980 RepID=UPI0001E5753E|nr:flagellar hook-length control protein FliK [Roseibium sp. TrichSKD4]EFO29349.1 conserved hypothetical protein [Roseibium sp. TrichSKD4]
MVVPVEAVQASLTQKTTGGGFPLKPGAEVAAKVDAVLPNNVVRLNVAGTSVDVRVSQPLPEGTELTVKVEGSAAKPEVQLLPRQQAAPPSPQAPAQNPANSQGAIPQQQTATNQTSPPPDSGRPVSQAALQPLNVQTGSSGLPQKPVALLLDVTGRPVGAPVLPQTGGGAGAPQSAHKSTPLTPQTPGAPSQGTPAPQAPQSRSTNAPAASAPSTAGTTQAQGVQTSLPASTTPPTSTGGSSTGAAAPLPQTGGNPTSVQGGGTIPTTAQGQTAAQTGTPSGPSAATTPTGAQAGGSPPQTGQPPVTSSQPTTAQGFAPQSANPASGTIPPSGTPTTPAAGGAPPSSGSNVAAPPIAPGQQGTVQQTPNQGAPGQSTLTQPATGLPQGAPASSANPATSQSPLPAQTQASGRVGQPVSLSGQASVPQAQRGGRSGPSQNANAPSVPTGSAPPGTQKAANGATQATAQTLGQTLGGTKPPVSADVARAAQTVLPKLTEQQASLSGAFAQLASLSSRSAIGISKVPEPVQTVVQQLLGLRLGSGETTGKDVQNLVKNSGVFREAALARGGGLLPPGALSGQGAQQAGGDIKSLLLQLRGFLKGMGIDPAPQKPLTQPPVPSLVGGPRGQRPSLPSSGPDGDEIQQLSKLLSDTDAALSRIRLTQMVSRGMTEEVQAQAGRAMDVVVELPLNLGQENSVLQMQVGRDPDHTGEDENGEPGWRLRFALDLTATGPMEAAVSLRGGGTFVSLWMERGETFKAMSGEREAMEATFAHAGLDLKELRFLRGLPKKADARYGVKLDRTS